jgi:hypothetical protein
VAALALLGSGTALAVSGGIDFLAEQERVDRRQTWDAPDIAASPRVELRRGKDWSFMAWRGRDSRWCLGWAAGTAQSWARACGASVSGGAGHLVTALFASMAGEDGLAGLGGLVTADVHRVEIETLNLGRITAPTTPSPTLGDELRYFLIRVPSSELNADATPRRPPVLALRLYADDGRLLDANGLE